MNGGPHENLVVRWNDVDGLDSAWKIIAAKSPA